LPLELPFISTNCGNSEGIAKISGNKIITSPKEMANEIDNLCQNKIKYLQISEKGFNVWKNNFTWEKITDQYEKIYDNNKT
jgi:glycosyltransferase involved in cell wall biosynthesis